MEGGCGSKQQLCCAAHYGSRGDFGGRANRNVSNPGPAEIHLSPQKCPSRVRYKAEIGPTAGNKQPRGCVGRGSGKRRYNSLIRTINR